MSPSKAAILIIGMGPHTERNHLPALQREHEAGRVAAVVGFDIPEAAPRIAGYLGSVGMPVPVHYAEELFEDRRTLPASVRRQLDAIAARHHITGVVVACEPSYHLPYALWTIDRGLPLMLDKPIAVRQNSSLDSRQASLILDDYEHLLQRHRQESRVAPGAPVTVMCQRRHHPLYRKVGELVREVTARTSCPVTSMQSFHSDGQWRLPNELVDISYHSFDRGYGKIAHSGYHFIDFMSTTVRAGLGGRTLDEVEIYTSAARPADYLAQLPPQAYPPLFEGVPFDAERIGGRLLAATARHGEVDAFVSLGFRSAGQLLCLGSINLVHNGLSLRHSAFPDMANLYRGTGRIRHETHIIEQGPFQAIHLHSLRSGDPGRETDAVGGEGHLELHVFRNNRLFPDWAAYERLTVLDLLDDESAWADHQQSARSRAMTEFVSLLNGELSPVDVTSPLADHHLGSAILSGTYLSLARRAEGSSPAVTMKLA